jgi:hypothetical protein
MTRQEALAALRVFTEDKITTKHHEQADQILCALLKDLGCADVVDEYNKLEKFYD